MLITVLPNFMFLVTFFLHLKGIFTATAGLAQDPPSLTPIYGGPLLSETHKMLFAELIKQLTVNVTCCLLPAAQWEVGR